MYELALKEKLTVLVWNILNLDYVCVDVKPINSEKLCCIVSSRCGKKSALAKRGNMPDASQESTPEAVCRADRSTGQVLAKYRDSYLYPDIL